MDHCWSGCRRHGCCRRHHLYRRQCGHGAEGREAKASAEFDPAMFTPADHAALSGAWSWFGEVVGPAVEAGPGGLIDDDLAYITRWGVDPGQIHRPVLLMHGGRDRVVPSSHGQWLARHCPTAQLRLFPPKTGTSPCSTPVPGPWTG